MLWLVLGIAIGFAWHWFLGWAQARNVHISLLVWFLLVYTLVAGLSGVQNFVALTAEYEEHAAGMVVPVYGIQTLVGIVPALLLLWRAQRKATASK